ncbi:2-dehydropantoate 2-reductase [Marisediminicola sp. UYEF4]|uniref:ketopantoate reductase family protein n=1 Tax=Marisediminicola sp. UYEF4 TaxID=1756384 RepID=UPI003399ACB6
MKVAVIGAGAVGGTIAALLDRAGHDVEVTARGEHLEAIAERGIRLTGAWGEHTAHVTASESLRARPEIAFVTTKAHDADAAVRAAGDLLDGIPVVIVQNGLGGVSGATNANPRAHVVGALALFAASYLSPGDIAVTATGSLYLGQDSAGASDVAGRMLGEVLPVVVTRDFAGALWTKLVVNQINALPAITGMSAQTVIADRALRRIMTDGMRETVRVALATGVWFAPLQGLTHRILVAFVRAPFAIAQLLPLLFARRMSTVPNPGSTLQSIRRGQRTEVDYLNGAVVEAARAAGRAAPVNASLVALVHEVEASGRFLTPAEVHARAGRSRRL